MPQQGKDGRVTFKEYSIFDQDYELDRGPTSLCSNVFEIKVLDRMFTLYTEENSLMENFVLYIEKIIALKNEI